MADRKKNKLMKKIMHALHTLFEFLFKFRKAFGKSSAKGLTKATKKSSHKTAVKSSKAAAHHSHSIFHPIGFITKSLAGVGITVSSTTASIMAICAILLLGGFVAFNYMNNPTQFPNQISESVFPPISGLIGGNSQNGISLPNLASTNPLSIGVGEGNTTISPNGGSSSENGNGHSSSSNGNSHSSSSSNGNNPTSSDSGSNTPSIDFEIPKNP